MRKNRACDPCAARKAKCDRQSPCRRCADLSISCVAVRQQSKSGPKGPWARKRYESQLTDDERNGLGREPHLQSLRAQNSKPAPYNMSPPITPPHLTPHVSSNIPIPILRRYLDIYQRELYPVWPVVDTDELVLQIQEHNDVQAYALATAICAVTIAQLNVSSEAGSRLPVTDGLAMIFESERARHEIDYQDNPSLTALLSSFFMHISCANRGKIHKATFLLREAITFAQILGLDRASHFHGLCKQEEQLHLRIVWLLFITERGHTTRFELPRTLRLSSNIPKLEASEKSAILCAFLSMCTLFQKFGFAMDEGSQYRNQQFYVAMHGHLRETEEHSQLKSDLQRADFLITQQWMRVVLWKASLFHVELSTSPTDEGLSLCLPDHIARNVVLHLNTFPTHIVEAHGLGMEMKLFDIAISLADIVLCGLTAPIDRQLMQVSPRDVLSGFALYLTSFRGGDTVKMQLLQHKLYDTTSSIASIPNNLRSGQVPLATDGNEG